MQNDNELFSVIYRMAKREPETIIVTADNGFTNFNTFQKIFPKKFLNFGISEANMISFAAGMASCGRVPFAFAITTFLTMRAYEQIRNDICLAKRNVKLVGVGAGLYYGKLGNSHHAVEDLALFCVLPNMTVLCPCNVSEMKEAIKSAKQIDGPVYIRYNSGVKEKIQLPEYDFMVGKGVVLKQGQDIAIISTGDILYDVFEVAAILERKGYSIRIVHMHTVKPIDKEIILESAKMTKNIITIEEHSIIGGMGSQVADVLASECKYKTNFMKIGIEDIYPKGYGSIEEVKRVNGLAPDIMAKKIEEFYFERGK